MPTVNRREFLGLLGASLAAAACGGGPTGPVYLSPEVVMFSTAGYVPFSDYVWTVDPADASVNVFLVPSGERSYPAASARSLKGPVAVGAEVGMPDGTVPTIIYLYQPPATFKQLWSKPPGSPGQIALSLDTSLLAAVYSPNQDTYQEMWIFPTNGDAPINVTALRPIEGRMGDFSPHWSPDGSKLLIRRISEPLAGGQESTQLLVYEPATQSVSVLTAPVSDVIVACYGPNGSLIERRNQFLQMIAPDGTATPLLPPDAIPGLLPSDIGLAYSSRLNAVAFTMARKLGTNSFQDEIWYLQLDGGVPKQLWAAGDDRLIGLCFAAT